MHRDSSASEQFSYDLRRSNRVERERSPDIDDDVTGKELDREASRHLGGLDDTNRQWVSKHLVMAGRLIDIDPQLAFDHAVAASRRGGRLSVVREAVGITAYAAGDYEEALRELRTYRRMSGDQTHLPLMVDCLRAAGSIDKALELANSDDADQLSAGMKAELALVVSGIHYDVKAFERAKQALEIPELTRKRAFPISPRLYAAYADILEALEQPEQAQQWRDHIDVVERALGTGNFEDPEIMDFGEEISQDDSAKTGRGQDRKKNHRDRSDSGPRSGDRPRGEHGRGDRGRSS